jgi:hypothetical protein
MNPLALIIFLLVGFFGNWGLAFALLGAYLFAFVIAGYMQGRGKI